MKRKVGKEWEDTFAMIVRDIERRATAEEEDSGGSDGGDREVARRRGENPE